MSLAGQFLPPRLGSRTGKAPSVHSRRRAWRLPVGIKPGPSEHLVDGKAFAMEAHFVHQNAAGGLGVIGVLMAAGTSNPVFKKVVETMPASPGAPVAADPGIDPNALLPKKRSY